MDKTAQKRSLLNKMWEKTNVSGIAAEKFFNPQFQKVMEDLRLKDDNIRSIVAGEAIGDGDAGKDPISLKQLLKSSKSNLNRREYMSAIADLGRFHAKLFELQDWIKQLDATVNEVHHEFLFKDLDDDKKKHLHDLKTRLAAERSAELVKQAGIMDFFHNIGTRRGRALAAWEKRYPKQTSKLKKDTANLNSKSEAILAQVLSALKEMASARSGRNVDNYMKSAEKITKGYEIYDKIFRDYYTANVKGFLEKVELLPPEKPSKEDPASMDPETLKMNGPHTVNVGPANEVLDLTKNSPSSSPSSNVPFDLINRKTDPAGPPSNMDSGPPTSSGTPSSGAGLPYNPTMLSPGMPAIPSPPRVPSGIPSGTTIHHAPQTLGGPPPVPARNTLIGVAPPASPTPAPMPSPIAPNQSGVQSRRMSPDEMRSLEQQYGVQSEAHSNFYNSLKALSGESPLILGHYIAKYAKSIQNSDPTVSIQLLQIAKNIKG